MVVVFLAQSQAVFDECNISSNPIRAVNDHGDEPRGFLAHYS
ncbi:hypothetical protein FHU42_000018 [Corynebacterium glutamicum]|nr:hypothetical protein [Corynebacterium glutamicum]